MSAHFRTRLLRCSNWQTTGWSRDGMLWKRVAKVEQRPINTRWFSAKRQRHCVGARRIRPKCIVRVCPAVEVTVGFIPCYYNRIMKDKIWQSYSKKQKGGIFWGTQCTSNGTYTQYTPVYIFTTGSTASHSSKFQSCSVINFQQTMQTYMIRVKLLLNNQQNLDILASC